MTADPVDALQDQLDELWSMVGALDDSQLGRPSACEGWSIADVLLHLAQTNEVTIASVRGDSNAVTEMWTGVRGERRDVDDWAGAAVAAERGQAPSAVRDRWKHSADAMVAALAGCDPHQRVRWVVGEMAARTLATTRIAETWIHTGDIAAGLDAEHTATDGLFHVARLVHRTLPYAFERAGASDPGPVRFELTPPTGDTPWRFGPDDAPTAVVGPAVDLCLVAGQRATAATTSLQGSGPGADTVLSLMRTFA